jgi:hypothetical protein
MVMAKPVGEDPLHYNLKAFPSRRLKPPAAPRVARRLGDPDILCDIPQQGGAVMMCFFIRHGRVAAAFLAVLFVSSCDSVDFDYPDGKVSFSSPPVEISGAESFGPMGGLNVLPKDHGGFHLREPYRFPASVPVIAVANGVIVRVSNGTREVPPIPDAPEEVWGRQYDDHLIELKVSETITVNYAHVSAWGPATEAEFGDMPKSEEGRNVEFVVSAGDTIGYVGPHGTMDFSVFDYDLDPDILNPDIYPEGYIYAANIFDYWQQPLRGQLEAIALREVPPLGGKIDYDIEGRIIGNWFLEGTEEFIQWSRQLAIVYHDVFGERIAISDGSPMRDVPGIENPGAPDNFWVRGNSPAPEDIGVGDGVVKYTLIYGRDGFREPPFDDNDRPVQGVALVEMLETGKIRFQVFKGVEDAAGFTSSAKIYVRNP